MINAGSAVAAASRLRLFQNALAPIALLTLFLELL
jgi:hypothetical protein